MTQRTQLVVFRVDRRNYALPLASVERIVRAVEVTALPGAPAVVRGAIDVHGNVLPVFDLRRRFHLPDRDISPEHHLLIAMAGERRIALLIDDAQPVVERDASSVIDPESVAPGLERFQGLAQLDDGLVLIHDLPRFLSIDEARALESAMRAYG